MIVLDSSALVAILTREPERDEFLQAMTGAKLCIVSALTYQETAQVMYARTRDEGIGDLDDLLDAVATERVPYTHDMAQAAVAAFKRYGKGFNSKAKLNFCDCAAYALAKLLDAPLLYKGEDFIHTDVKPWR